MLAHHAHSIFSRMHVAGASQTHRDTHFLWFMQPVTRTETSGRHVSQLQLTLHTELLAAGTLEPHGCSPISPGVSGLFFDLLNGSKSIASPWPHEVVLGRFSEQELSNEGKKKATKCSMCVNRVDDTAWAMGPSIAMLQGPWSWCQFPLPSVALSPFPQATSLSCWCCAWHPLPSSVL